jgi:hypothetical protein
MIPQQVTQFISSTEDYIREMQSRGFYNLRIYSSGFDQG